MVEGGGRLISKEERYVDEIAQYAKSLGCVCDVTLDVNDYPFTSYSVFSFTGEDCVPPSNFWLNISLNGKLICQLHFDGRDICHSKSCYNSYKEFYFHLFEYEEPYIGSKKFWWKIKKFFGLKAEFPFTYNFKKTLWLLPEFYDIKVDNIKVLKNEKYYTTDDLKYYIKYMVYENPKNLKLRKEFNRLQSLEEDF